MEPKDIMSLTTLIIAIIYFSWCSWKAYVTKRKNDETP